MDRDLVVTVLFDFEYHGSDGQRVHMHKDEEFLVIQQTNSDWWQVPVQRVYSDDLGTVRHGVVRVCHFFGIMPFNCECYCAFVLYLNF